MTLKEMKDKVLSMIEEISPNNPNLTDDPDISEKINVVINQVQNELSRIKKIPAKKTLIVEENQETDFNELADDMYQLNIIRGVRHDIIGQTVIFNDYGNAKIYYYKYPIQINKDTGNDFEFELSTDVLEIMPYGVASDLLKSDISAQYGQQYGTRYESMKQNLDPRYHTGSIYIEGDNSEFL